MKVFFSIIIPTYNRANLIESAIASVLKQTHTDFELIIVDDGSTDDTENIVLSIKDTRIKYIKTENAERAAARNTGSKIAEGDYITFLDSDDIFFQNHLSVARSTLQKYGFPEVAHIRYEIKDMASGKSFPMKMLKGDLNQKLIQGNFMSCNAVFLKNKVAKENLFNEDRMLSAMEDWELWLRIASKYKIYYDNTITSAIINHEKRSVLKTNIDELIIRVNTLIKYVLQNKNVTDFYKKSLYKFESSCYTYVALHIGLTKTNRKQALNYLIKGIRKNPVAIFNKRFLAILKHLM